MSVTAARWSSPATLASHNEWREQRRKNPFLRARTEGKGQIIYIPEIKPGDAGADKKLAGTDDAEPGAAGTHTPRMSPAQWVLPRNHEEIFTRLVKGVNDGLSLVTRAPLTTVAELVTRPDTRETMAHFVNFDRAHPLEPFAASVRKQFTGPVKSVTCFSPDASEPQPLAFKESDNRVTFTVPAMRIYSMIVIGQ